MKKKTTKKKATVNKAIVSIEFGNPKAAKYFMLWLCEGGEQDYWQWQECREEEEEGYITAVEFDYDFKKRKIKTTLGRLDKNE